MIDVAYTMRRTVVARSVGLRFEQLASVAAHDIPKWARTVNVYDVDTGNIVDCTSMQEGDDDFEAYVRRYIANRFPSDTP
jgi:hypothetical protein